MTARIPLVAIVGRTNVGKSTLFNAIAGRRLAIVEDTPGVTRDRAYTLVKRFGFLFNLVDTGGVVGDEDAELQQLVRDQAEVAIAESDLVLAVFDGVEGVHPLDWDVAELARRSNKPVISIINKCEKQEHQIQAPEFHSLGLDELHPMSAAHHQGLRELIEKIERALVSQDIQLPTEREDHVPAIRVAIVGKPNVGKSTLVNRILGEDRLVTSAIAGTTRDSIDVQVKRDGRDFLFCDTAGLRKRARVEDASVERYSALRTLRAIAGCDVGVLVIDATEGIPTEQDTKIGGVIHERGKGFVIVVNKWDLVEKDHRTVKAFTDAIYEQFKFARYAPILFVSGLTGRRCPSILETVAAVYDSRRLRIKTSELNRVLQAAFERRPPPVYRGNPIKLQFGVQVAIEPPTFVLFLNHPTRIGFGYERYIRNALRETYPFVGVDLKLQLRKKSEKEAAEEAESRK
jgi:GTP-binding protein